MSSIEQLKQELVTQKEQIEKKGGVVSVANNYPSPSEITEGIKTITGSDFSLATAVESDVKQGKTFYAGSPGVKTGSAIFDGDAIHHIFMAPEEVQTTEENVYYSFPAGINKIKKYCFYKNFNKINFIFNADIQTIDEYAFYMTKNIYCSNFTSLTGLTRVNNYAFAYSGLGGINLVDYPPNLTTCEGYIFLNTIENAPHITDIKVPSSITSMGVGMYKHSNRININSLDISETSLTSLGDHMVYNIGFDCDLNIPTHVKEVGDYFNYGGSFNNITIPAGVALRGYAFYAPVAQAVSDFHLKTVTFLSASHGTIGTNLFAQQNITNGFKIYVPDEAVDSYKAISNLSRYADCIYGISEKD